MMREIMMAINNVLKRFSGFSKTGSFERVPDTRSFKQLAANINGFAQDMPEIKEFLPELSKMDVKHLGLFSDVIELSRTNVLMSVNLNPKSPVKEATFLQNIIPDMIDASKNNPNALNFMKGIIDNTDELTSKFALVELSGGILRENSLAKHFKAATKLIPDVAKEVLPGFYTTNLAKQKTFMELFKSLINPTAKIELLEMVPEAIETIRKTPLNDGVVFNIREFVRSNASVEKIKDNLKTLPEIVQGLFNKGTKVFDMDGYLTKNTNMY